MSDTMKWLFIGCAVIGIVGSAAQVYGGDTSNLLWLRLPGLGFVLGWLVRDLLEGGRG